AGEREERQVEGRSEDEAEGQEGGKGCGEGQESSAGQEVEGREEEREEEREERFEETLARESKDAQLRAGNCFVDEPRHIKRCFRALDVAEPRARHGVLR